MLLIPDMPYRRISIAAPAQRGFIVDVFENASKLFDPDISLSKIDSILETQNFSLQKYQ